MNTTIQQLGNTIKDIFTNQDSILCKRFLYELNAFRMSPQIIIPNLQKRKLNYSIDQKHKILFSPNHPYKGLLTQQGPQPVDSLIQQLQTFQHIKQQKSQLPTSLTLQQNPTLSLIAKTIASTFIQIKQLSQLKLTQSYAKYLRKQLNNSTQYDFVDSITCLIGVGFDGDEYQPLISLLIDDGDSKQRRNRKILLNLNQRFRFVGVGTVKLRFKQQLRVVVYLLTGNIHKKQ